MRDYYCSKISKASYCYHPIDFIILSGILSAHFNIFIIDCITEKLNSSESLKRIIKINPEVIIFLSGAVSLGSDMPFLWKIKSKIKCLMVGIGDIFIDYGKELLENNSFMDAILLDFTTNDIVSFIKKKDSAYFNIIFKDKENIVMRRELHASGVFSIPTPRHDLFKNRNYGFPFARRRRFATVMTDFGCPFKCSYCVVNRFGYKKREISGVMEEIKFIKDIKIHEIVFKDQTFAADRQRAFLLCEEIINNNINIGWICFSRTDIMDEELLLTMKKAGCHTIIFGVEILSQELLSNFNRKLDLQKTKEVFSLCKRFGIDTVGTFIIGLPGDNKEMIKKTIQFSIQIGCDYASFNIFTPSYGTELRKKLIENSMVEDSLCFMDSGISYPTIETKHLNRAEIWSLRQEAIRSFYLRPAYFMERIYCLHNLSDLRSKLRNGLSILMNHITSCMVKD
ncbi:MAG: radical SAM protein [Candidatus Omnitrophota bacterium]